MSAALKWTTRIVAGVMLVIVAAVVSAFVRFSLWSSDHDRALAADSRIVRTALGDVEVAVVGRGTPVLSLHGTPGGYDQGLITRRAIPEIGADSMTVTVSRSGYLRTPLTASNATFEQQADLFAALLDFLHIDRSIVVASSGGGYVGLQLALRHPERCIALVLLAPAVRTEALPGDLEPSPTWLATLRDLAIWTLAGIAPGVFVEGFDSGNPEHKALIGLLVDTLVPTTARQTGRRNDRVQRADRAVDQWPLERVSVPTLLMHGTADENSPYEDSQYVASRIPGARLITLPGADHLFAITRAREVDKTIHDFVVGIAQSRESSTR